LVRALSWADLLLVTKVDRSGAGKKRRQLQGKTVELGLELSAKDIANFRITLAQLTQGGPQPARLESAFFDDLNRSKSASREAIGSSLGIASGVYQ